MRTMRKLVVLSLLLGLVAVPLTFAGKDANKKHQMKVEVVSVDTSGNTITFKNDDGKQMTAPVMEAAQGKLGSLKAGEKVELTCEDDADGNHLGIVAIKPTKS